MLHIDGSSVLLRFRSPSFSFYLCFLHSTFSFFLSSLSLSLFSLCLLIWFDQSPCQPSESLILVHSLVRFLAILHYSSILPVCATLLLNICSNKYQEIVEKRQFFVFTSKQVVRLFREDFIVYRKIRIGFILPPPLPYCHRKNKKQKSTRYFCLPYCTFCFLTK